MDHAIARAFCSIADELTHDAWMQIVKMVEESGDRSQASCPQSRENQMANPMRYPG
jgi:hypothetical protein